MGIFSFLGELQQAFENWIIATHITEPPWSALFLLVVSFTLSGITGGLNRLLLDMEEIEEKQAKVNKHNERKQKAMETADKKLWIQVKRNEDNIMSLQRSMMFKRMAPSLITMGPFIFVFTTLRSAFQQRVNLDLNAWCLDGTKSCDVGQGRHGALAVLPFNAHDIPLIGNWFSPFAYNTGISIAGFSFWYFLSAIVVSQLIQKIFGINLTGMQSPGTGGMR